MTSKHTSELYKEHRARMRQRIIANGSDIFEDVKLLEVLLYDIIPRVDTYPVAYNLIKEFKTLDGVFSASAKDLMRVEGVGEKTSFHIALIGVIYNRIVENEFASHPLDSYEAINSYLVWIFRKEKVDSSAVLYLTEKGELIECVKYPYNSKIKPRISEDIEKTVAENKAARVVLSHKHYENCLKPSPEDLDSTQLFYEICQRIGTRAEEHFIVSGSSILPIMGRVTGQKTELFEKSL